VVGLIRTGVLVMIAVSLLALGFTARGSVERWEAAVLVVVL